MSKNYSVAYTNEALDDGPGSKTNTGTVSTVAAARISLTDDKNQDTVTSKNVEDNISCRDGKDAARPENPGPQREQ